MARVSGLPLLLLIALTACGADGSAPEARPGTDRAQAPARPRHVVLYVIDTLRQDRLGVYGAAPVVSPAIDRLAAEAWVFDDCTSTAPRTLPAVASLLTSTHPTEHRVFEHRTWAQEPELRPLSLRLKDLGYETAAFVANPYAGAAVGLDQAHDHFLDRPDLEAVDQWLGQRREGPVYLHFHSLEPHMPYAAPPDILREVAGLAPEEAKALTRQLHAFRQLAHRDKAELAQGDTDTSAQAAAAEALGASREVIDRLYQACVRRADQHLEQLVALLEKHGLWEDTVFLLVSDHGEELYDHGGWFHGQSLYRELTRVPMIWRLPEDLGGQGRVATPVSLLDVLPTLADLLGAPALADGARGRSLLPLMTGGEVAPGGMHVEALRVNRTWYFEPYARDRGNVNLSVRNGDWRGIWNVDPDTLELYDLSADPAETTDVSDQHPDIARAMREFARAWLESFPPLPAASANAGDLDPEVLEKLRALGYIR